MSNYTGVVSKVFPKSNWGTYSFGLRGVTGYFGTGKVPPFFSEGQTISFSGNPAKRAGNVDVLVESIKIETETPVATEDYSMVKQSGAQKSVVLQKDDYWKNREDRDIAVQKVIQIQAARNAAIAVLAVTGPEINGEAVPVEDFINVWTDIFLNNNDKRAAS